MEGDNPQPVQPQMSSAVAPEVKKSKLWIWIIVGIIIIGFGGGGFLTYNYFSKPRIIEEQIEGSNMVTCIDSDGGDNIYTKGKASYSRQSPEAGEGIIEGSMGDYCDYFHDKTESSVGLIREGICEGNTFKMVWKTCGWGYVCRNAACVKGGKDLPICYDSDGGKNTNQKGNVIATGGSADDSCWVSIDGTLENGTGTGKCEQEAISAGRCYVNEYFCENDRRTEEKILCSNGCDEGKCL